jgi:murein DD-endopeptidase MepM/ murein hydrolase activator NlpD
MPSLSHRVLSLAVLAFTLAGIDSARSQVAPSRGYVAPEPRANVFPVARSEWYSVINLKDDWLAPRRRFVDGRWRQVGVHEGNDIFAEPGTPVRAVTDGVVEQAGWLFYSGWRVGIRADDGRYWFYAHLAEAPGLAQGQRVEAGQTIGLVGNTGYGSNPGHKDEFSAHLHVGIREPSGEWVNPYPMMKRLYENAQGR